MQLLIRIIAAFAALSVFGTLWFLVGFASAGGFQRLPEARSLGILTVVGWAVTLVAGPIAAHQLWSFREAGRRAGIVLFGNGIAYYAAGLVALRAADAPVLPIVTTGLMFALPLAALLSPPVRSFIASRESAATGEHLR